MSTATKTKPIYIRPKLHARLKSIAALSGKSLAQFCEEKLASVKTTPKNGARK